MPELALAGNCEYPDLLIGGLGLCPHDLGTAGIGSSKRDDRNRAGFLDGKSHFRHSVKDSRLSEDTDLYHFFHTLVTNAGHRMTLIHRERVPWNTGAGSPLPSEFKTLNR